MKLSVTVCARSQEQEEKWAQDLILCLQGKVDFEISLASLNSKKSNLKPILILDSKMDQIEKFLKKIDRRQHALFLVVDDRSSYPELLVKNQVDDLIFFPFRALEVMSKFRFLEKIQMWNEVSELNSSFSEIIQRLTDDFSLAERLQKANLPKKFESIQGFKIASRYLAGVQPGGNYFDLIQSPEGDYLSWLFTDSSTYGLSAAVLSTLMRVGMKVSGQKMENSREIAEAVGLIYDDLALTLKENDHLSLFYGVFSRHDQRFRFLNLGNSRLFYFSLGQGVKKLESQGGVLSRLSGFTPFPVGEIQFSPLDRMILCSRGVIEGVGGEVKLLKIIDSVKNSNGDELPEGVDTLNEIVYQIKSHLSDQVADKMADQGDLPKSDCTVILIDVDSSVVQLGTKLQKPAAT